MSTEPLHLMVYDAGAGALSRVWWGGQHLYRALGRFDAALPARSWEHAFGWLASFAPERTIGSVQYWGHGNWGRARIGGDLFDISALRRDHPHRASLAAIAARLQPESLWWFRTCETFGARPGHDFARALGDTLGCHSAGHTFIIAFWQSGLHRLAPGAAPTWDPTEGLQLGTATCPEKALWSSLWQPNTISCLRGTIPREYE